MGSMEPSILLPQSRASSAAGSNFTLPGMAPPSPTAGVAKQPPPSSAGSDSWAGSAKSCGYTASARSTVDNYVAHLLNDCADLDAMLFPSGPTTEVDCFSDMPSAPALP